MAYVGQILADGQELKFYSVNNQYIGSIKMSVSALELSGAGTHVGIKSGNDLLFLGSSHSIKAATSGTLNVGSAGNPLNLYGNIFHASDSTTYFNGVVNSDMKFDTSTGSKYIYRKVGSSWSPAISFMSDGKTFINQNSTYFGSSSISLEISADNGSGSRAIGVRANAFYLYGYDTYGPKVHFGTSGNSRWQLAITDSTTPDINFYEVNGAKDRLTLKAGGRIGIGNSNPSADLHIGSGGLGYVDRDRLIIQPPYHTGGPWKVSARDTGTTAFLDTAYGSTKIMSLTSNGNVLIGTTTDDEISKLQVNGTVKAEYFHSASGFMFEHPSINTANFTVSTQDGQGYVSSPSLYVHSSGSIYLGCDWTMGINGPATMCINPLSIRIYDEYQSAYGDYTNSSISLWHFDYGHVFTVSPNNFAYTSLGNNIIEYDGFLGLGYDGLDLFLKGTVQFAGGSTRFIIPHKETSGYTGVDGEIIYEPSTTKYYAWKSGGWTVFV